MTRKEIEKILGYKAGILGNSITEMKASFSLHRTYGCIYVLLMLYYMYERKSYTLPHIRMQYQLPCGVVCKVQTQDSECGS